MNWSAEFMAGAGLGLLALGFAMMVGVPPPGWPKMPRFLVRASFAGGVVVFLAGLSLIATSSCISNNAGVCPAVIAKWNVIRSLFWPLLLAIVTISSLVGAAFNKADWTPAAATLLCCLMFAWAVVWRPWQVVTSTPAKPLQTERRPNPSVCSSGDSNSYHVLAASTGNESDAQKIASAITSEDHSIKASPLDPAPCNDQWAVIAGDPSSKCDAENIAKRIKGMKAVGARIPLVRKIEKLSDPAFCKNKKNDAAVEAICGDACLKKIDNLENAYYGDFNDRTGVGVRLWKARQACYDNKLCIMDQQLFAISIYNSDASLSDFSKYRLRLYQKQRQENELPSGCTVPNPTISKKLSDRLEFSNGNVQVLSPDAIDARRGDAVLTCSVLTKQISCSGILGMPYKKPQTTYLTTDLVTNDSWIASDSPCDQNN